jgi:hypothetical protein
MVSRTFAALLCLIAMVAFAGDFHTDEFPATVIALEHVPGYSLKDPFLEAGTPGAPDAGSAGQILRPETPACAVTLRVGGAFASMS